MGGAADTHTPCGFIEAPVMTLPEAKTTWKPQADGVATPEVSTVTTIV